MDILVNLKENSSYSIISGSGYESFAKLFKNKFENAKQVCIVSDENVSKLYMDNLMHLLCERYEVKTFVINAGESSKNIDNVLKLVSILIDSNFSRKDVLIGLGGGVVCDFTGFAAALYHRGIEHVLLPTSLLAMVDASIGGKTAVDYMGIKNIIGSFKMPGLIYINIDALNDLPEREYYAGFAEIMKAGLLFDANFYVWLIDNMYEICEKDFDTLNSMIEKAIIIKKTIVEKDPFDKGERALLNLGHTVGHAIESYFKGEYIHGEAVALGCVAAAFISWKMNMISMEDYYEIRDMFVPFNLPISIQVDKSELNKIFDILIKDKKNTLNSLNFVLLKKIGKAIVVNDVPAKLVMDALDEINFSIED